MNLLIRKILLIKWLYYVILLLSIIYSLYVINRPTKLKYNLNEDTISGYVLEYSINGSKLSILLNTKEKIKGTYYIDNISTKQILIKQLKYGQLVILKGELSIPLANTIPNTFNYKNYLKSIGVNLIIKVNEMEVLNNRLSLFNKIKNHLYSLVDNLSCKDYIYTLVLGNKTALSTESIQNYQINGVTHLFALSGMHVSFFSAILLFILKKCHIKETKRYIVCFGFLIFYSVLTGMSPSILISTIFFILLSINKILYLNIKSIYIFILSVSLLVLIYPTFILNLGFQYAVLATFGLIYSSHLLSKGNYFYKVLKTSFVASLFTLPITINNFFEFNLLSFLCNIIFVPIVSIIIYPICIFTMFIPFLDHILYILKIVVEYLSDFFALFSIYITISKLSAIVIIIYYIFLLFIIKKQKHYSWLLGLLFISNLFPYLDYNYWVYYIDVGQGDCTLIIAPNLKEIVLIDTGGKLDYEMEEWQKQDNTFHISNSLITFFKSLGITKIDLLIASHGDEDHIGEALRINQKIKIKHVIINQGNINNLEKEIISVIPNDNYKTNQLNLNNINLPSTIDENDNSIITYLKIYNYSFLFTGDLPKNREAELINDYRLSKIDFYKMGHHGSKTSNSELLLRTITPSLTIISSGRNNRFNHPSKETIDNLNNLNIKYYNTQITGTIAIKLINNKYFITNYPP